MTYACDLQFKFLFKTVLHIFRAEQRNAGLSQNAMAP